MPLYTILKDNIIQRQVGCRSHRIESQLAPGETYIVGRIDLSEYRRELDDQGKPVPLTAEEKAERSLSVADRLARDYPEPSDKQKLAKLIDVLKAQGVDLSAYDRWYSSMSTKV